MASSSKKYTAERALQMMLESEDEGESWAESSLTDDELSYQDGLDPAEE